MFFSASFFDASEKWLKIKKKLKIEENFGEKARDAFALL